MKKEKKLLIAQIVLMAATIGSFASYLALKINGTIDQIRWLGYIYFAVLPIVFASFVLMLFTYINEVIKRKNLYVENRYQFGVPSDFPNYFVFADRIKSLKKLHSKKEKTFLVSFTVSNLSVMNSAGRNADVLQLNHLVSEFIAKHFSQKDLVNDFAYCFYHGQFLFYIFGSEKNIQQISLMVDEASYDAAFQNDIKVFVHPYIGVTEVDPKESLLVNLDNAILARDLSEKNFESITFYSPSFRRTATLTEIDEIKQALQNHEFVVYYQPKYHLATHRFISSEALVRWDSKKYGLLSPAKFIEKAELGGLIHEMDMYVFRKVCQDLSESRIKNKRILPVSINFSLYEFYDPSFVDDILEIINEYKLNPSFVEIEITESTSQVNPFMAITLMKKLKECGFRILMDDFGLAYSNLGNLNKMPFDTIKIDKSFVDGIVSDFKTREIVRFLIALCKVSGMEVIAEGVDQAEQVNILKKIKCDTIQGFFYSKPLPIKEYEEFLAENPFEKSEGGASK